jgi:hypothetical protein
MLKVGMRQPYPGIITFFLWGIVLSIIVGFRKERASREMVVRLG